MEIENIDLEDCFSFSLYTVLKIIAIKDFLALTMKAIMIIELKMLTGVAKQLGKTNKLQGN